MEGQYTKGLIALLAVTLAGLFFLASWPGRVLVYQGAEAFSSSRVVKTFAKTDRGMDHRPLELYFPKGQNALARTTMAIAEKALPRIESDLGYTVQKSIPVIIVDNPIRLDVSLGWPQSFRAEGAYDRGVVYLVSPGDAPKTLANYDKTGPVAHELTHFVLDQQTHGNYPSWYTEGLAQLEDYRITGFAWVVAQNNLLTQPLYSLKDLSGNFYALGNQAMAYREAFSLVSYMATRGPNSIARLDRSLAAGTPFAKSVQEVYGVSVPSLFNAWKSWMKVHSAPQGGLGQESSSGR